MPTYIAHRTDVVLSAVQPAWLTTSDLDSALYDAGHRWTTETTRHTLHYLASEGKIERRKRGNGYVWRTPPTPEPVQTAMGPQAQRDPLAVLDELRTAIERAQNPAAAPPEGLYVPDDADLADLLHADDQLVTRIVKRASYDALKGMSIVLDGWIEGARENHEAMSHRNENTGSECWTQFAPEDIRRMINDACRLMGTREVCTDATS